MPKKGDLTEMYGGVFAEIEAPHLAVDEKSVDDQIKQEDAKSQEMLKDMNLASLEIENDEEETEDGQRMMGTVKNSYRLANGSGNSKNSKDQVG